MENFLKIGFILIWAFLVFRTCLSYFIIYRLKIAHKETWESLGRPSLFSKNDFKKDKPIRLFIDNRKDFEFQDKILSIMIDLLTRLKKFDIVITLCFILFVLFFIVKYKIL